MTCSTLQGDRKIIIRCAVVAAPCRHVGNIDSCTGLNSTLQLRARDPARQFMHLAEASSVAAQVSATAIADSGRCYCADSCWWQQCYHLQLQQWTLFDCQTKLLCCWKQGSAFGLPELTEAEGLSCLQTFGGMMLRFAVQSAIWGSKLAEGRHACMIKISVTGATDLLKDCTRQKIEHKGPLNNGKNRSTRSLQSHRKHQCVLHVEQHVCTTCI